MARTDMIPTPDRRGFLRSAAGAAALGLVGGPGWAADGRRPKVAAVVTEFTFRSHGHVILENFLQPYYFQGRQTDPGCDLVSLYLDQFPAGRDMARAVAKEYKVPIYPTIAEALCRGGTELAVDSVLSIGEHGNYPMTPKGQKQYPRKRFFDEIVAVFRRSGRAVPVFNDKHLSYRWDWAKQMYDTARELNIPFMAGSSVPLAQRVPPVEVPAGAKVVEAVATHGGGLDSYDFHALEVLQSMVENRAGGETGVAKVQYLNGDALWRAADARVWSPELLRAAWAAAPDPRQPLESFDRGRMWGLLVHYRDGLRGLAVKVGGDGTRWTFACRLAGVAEPLATSFYVGPWRNRNLFKALSHAIQVHFREGKAPYPVERTLLTTGIVEAGVESHARGDAPYETPHLDIKYTPTDTRAVRETGESWKIVTEATPEPRGLDRLGKMAPPAAPAGSEKEYNPIRKG
jgi:hypothetical protein